MTAAALAIETGRLAVGEPDRNGVRAYKGIPYAAAPVGKLRWKPPQKAEAWKGLRPSGNYGFNAAQRIIFPDIDPFTVGISEDCLYLNVWTPAEPAVSSGLPVFFYIHGGGFAVGAGSEPRYDGSRLAAKGIVVVTMNYRLNALGLLAHPALSAETGSSGNFAMLDLVAALQWVKDNIAQFGGNPGAVTIAGESAGSMFVSMLMASPLSRGLFHGAIGQSGAQFPSPERPMLDLQQAEEQGLAFARKLNAKTADDLRAASMEAILDAHPGLGFWPIVDGHFLKEKPAATFAKGEQADVPLLAGWNRNEGMNFNVMAFPIPATSYAARLQLLFGNKTGDVAALYPGGEHEQRSARELGADLVIAWGTWAWLESHRATARSEVFRYRFDRAPQTTWFPNEPVQGAFHSCDIPYVMDNLQHAFDWKLDADDDKVASLASQFIINFVRSGNPNGTGLPAWPSYRHADHPVFLIDVKPSVAHDLERQRYELLAQLAV